METSQTTSVLRRKLVSAEANPKPGERTALGALRLAFARAGSDFSNLPLGVIGATQRRAGVDDLGKFIRDDWLLLLLDGPTGPNGPQTGAIMLNPDSVAALIQHLTMGAVSGGKTAVRSFTNTDAALAAPLIDGALTRAAELVQVAADARCLMGYSFGARAEDARVLSLAFDADKYRIFELSLDFTGGVMQGVACLILPEPPAPPKPEIIDTTGPCLGDVVGDVQAEMDTVLCRIQMTVAELSAMAVGDILPLPPGVFAKTELHSITGELVTTGQLGQSDGFRAIRLFGTTTEHWDEPDSFDMPVGVLSSEPSSGPNSDPNSDLGVGDVSNPEILEGSTPVKADIPYVSEFDESEEAALFDSLSVDEAVLEISELAGLPIPGLENGQPEGTGLLKRAD